MSKEFLAGDAYIPFVTHGAAGFLLRAIHIDDPGKDQYFQKHGIHVFVPLDAANGKMADITPAVVHAPGAPATIAIKRVGALEAQGNLPEGSYAQARQSLYDQAFESSEWAAYLPSDKPEA